MKGFTLLELVIVIALVAALALGSWQLGAHMLQQKKLTQIISQIEARFALLRLHALLSGQSQILCPALDHKNCSDDWRQDWIIKNPGSKEVTRVWQRFSNLAQLSWQGWQSSHIVRAVPNAQYSGLNGHFHLRMLSGKTFLLVVNQLGQIHKQAVS